MTPFAGCTPVTENVPFVSVPVLSNTTVSSPARVSRYVAPLMRIPFFDAPPMPEKNVSGTEITSAHGQEITRKVRAV